MPSQNIVSKRNNTIFMAAKNKQVSRPHFDCCSRDYSGKARSHLTWIVIKIIRILIILADKMCQLSSQSDFWTSDDIRSTCLSDIFLINKFSASTEYTLPVEMPTLIKSLFDFPAVSSFTKVYWCPWRGLLAPMMVHVIARNSLSEIQNATLQRSTSSGRVPQRLHHNHETWD